MKILNWNCRSLGNSWIIQDLHRMVMEKKPRIVFLMGTKMTAYKFDTIKKKMDWEGCFVVDSMGIKGGFGLVMEDVEVEIANFFQYHINAYIP